MTHSSRIYLAIEGIDGTGKTYVADYISKKYSFVKLQEPSKSELGNFISNGAWDPVTDFFLFMADRASFLKDLPRDTNYVSDRSLYSSFAYQGYYLMERFRGIDEYFEFFMNSSKILPFLPTHVFVLFSDVDLALKRISGRGKLTRFEKRDYLEKVQEIYFSLKGRVENIKFVDSNNALDDLFKLIDKEITSLSPRGHLPSNK